MFEYLLNNTAHMCFAPEAGDAGTAAPAATPAANADPIVPAAAAAPVTPAAAPAAAPAPAVPVGFLPEGSPEDVAYAQSKGWDKSGNPAADIFKSYQHLEKLFGADKAGNSIIVPGEGADAKQWGDVYNKLGRPEKVDGYSEGTFTGMSEELDVGLKAISHELGLSDKQLAGIRDWNNKSNEAIQTEYDQHAMVELGQQQTVLKEKWGAAHEQNMQKAQEASRAMGWSADQVNAMQMSLGYDGVMELALNIGNSVGEGKFVTPSGGRVSGGEGIMAPAQAKIELTKLGSDAEFNKAWMDKSHPKHGEMVARKTQLTNWANPTK